MFDKFDNTPEDYIPDNIHPPIPRYEEVFEIDNLDVLCHNKYSWDYGETLSIPVTNSFIIKVEDSSIIYDVAGVAPSQLTSGDIGTRAYNIVDVKSWRCVNISEGTEELPTLYEWQQDAKFTVPSGGTTEIVVNPSMVDKYLEAKIYNFRMEEMFTTRFEGVNSAHLEIDKELSSMLLPGIYYLRIYIVGYQDADEENIVSITLGSNIELFVR